MTEEEMRRKAAIAIRLALKAAQDSGFQALLECVSELDEDDQNALFAASEHLGDAILDVQGRERS
jgi:Fe-S cluster assembly iron-binding protein IscA